MNSQNVLTGALVGILLAVFPAAIPMATAAEQPNFVMILADDMGWIDAGFCGNKFIDTPHLDRLARGGVVFAQAKVARPRSENLHHHPPRTQRTARAHTAATRRHA